MPNREQFGSDLSERMSDIGPAFDRDPLGTVTAVQRGGFFEGLQSFGAALSAIGGDTGPSKFLQKQREQEGTQAFRAQKLQMQKKKDESAQASDLVKQMQAEPDPRVRKQLALSYAKADAGTDIDRAKVLAAVRDPEASGRLDLIQRIGKYSQEKAAVAQQMIEQKLISPEQAQRAVAGLNVQRLAEGAMAEGFISPDERELLRDKTMDEQTAQALGLVSGAAGADIAKTRATEAVKQEFPTEAVRTTEGLAEAAGLKRGTAEFKAFVRERALRPGAQTNVTIEGEKAGAKELAVGDIKDAKDMERAGQEAAERLSQIQTFKTSLASGRFTPGAAGEVRASLGRFMELVGLDPSVIPAIGDPAIADVMDSSAKNVAVKLTGDLKGIRATNAPLKLIQDAVPGLTRTADGNKVLIDIMERVEVRKQVISEMASQYLNEFGTPRPKGKPNLFQAVAALEKANPVIDDELKERIAAGSKSSIKSFKEMFMPKGSLGEREQKELEALRAKQRGKF